MPSSTLDNVQLLLQNTGEETYYRTQISCDGYAFFGPRTTGYGTAEIAAGDVNGTVQLSGSGGTKVYISAGEDHSEMYLKDSSSGTWHIDTTSTGDLKFWRAT